MIRAVYKGVMKAVARRLAEDVKSDMEKGNLRNYETYLMSGEAYAYEELCKAFRVKGGPPDFFNYKQLRGFVSCVVNEMGIHPAPNIICQDTLNDRDVVFVALWMPNRMWKFSLSPTFMSSVSSVPNPNSHILSPCRKLSVVLPDLDRMMPVLERMTRNILDDLKDDKKC